jgi:hypothetical protein
MGAGRRAVGAVGEGGDAALRIPAQPAADRLARDPVPARHLGDGEALHDLEHCELPLDVTLLLSHSHLSADEEHELCRQEKSGTSEPTELFAFNLGLRIRARLEPERYPDAVIAGEVEAYLARLSRGARPGE